MTTILYFLQNNWIPLLFSLFIGVISGYIVTIIPIPLLKKDKVVKDILKLKYSGWWSSRNKKLYIDHIKIKVKRRRIILYNINNEESYNWKASFELKDNQLIGDWEYTNTNGHKSKGAAYVRITGDTVKIGFWVGDAESNKIGYGFWLFGNNEIDLTNTSDALLKRGFSTVNLMTEVED